MPLLEKRNNAGNQKPQSQSAADYIAMSIGAALAFIAIWRIWTWYVDIYIKAGICFGCCLLCFVLMFLLSQIDNNKRNTRKE